MNHTIATIAVTNMIHIFVFQKVNQLSSSIPNVRCQIAIAPGGRSFATSS